MVEQLIERARKAQRELEQLSDSEVKKIILACAWAVLEPNRNQQLAEKAVATTGIGKVSDKIIKNERKTLGLLQDLESAITYGIISESPEKGIVEIARPLGVVGAITPSTNPIATPLNNIINAIVCRNAIILSPSPKGSAVMDDVLDYIMAELKFTKAPQNIIQRLSEESDKSASKKATADLMRLVDVIVCTGSRNNVRNSYKSGVPALGVGVGNVVTIVDETLGEPELKEAAHKIKLSKTFDHATSCSSENSLVVVAKNYSEMVRALQDQGGRLLNESEKKQLTATLWVEGNLNSRVIAHSASHIMEIVGLDATGAEEFIMVEEEGIGPEFPYSGEKLSPVLTLYRADNFDQAKQIASQIFDYQGKGHSVGIHTGNSERPKELGITLEVARIIVNQPHCFATGGSFENHLPFSLSMGCGSWGQNSFSGNLHYRHFYNTVRVAYPVPSREVSRDDMFREYLASK